jgi:hypothetical protein
MSVKRSGASATPWRRLDRVAGKNRAIQRGAAVGSRVWRLRRVHNKVESVCRSSGDLDKHNLFSASDRDGTLRLEYTDEYGADRALLALRRSPDARTAISAARASWLMKNRASVRSAGRPGFAIRTWFPIVLRRRVTAHLRFPIEYFPPGSTLLTVNFESVANLGQSRRPRFSMSASSKEPSGVDAKPS